MKMKSVPSKPSRLFQTHWLVSASFRGWWASIQIFQVYHHDFLLEMRGSHLPLQTWHSLKLPLRGRHGHTGVSTLTSVLDLAQLSMEGKALLMSELKLVLPCSNHSIYVTVLHAPPRPHQQKTCSVLFCLPRDWTDFEDPLKTFWGYCFPSICGQYYYFQPLRAT